MAFSCIQPFQYVALRLPNNSVKVEQIMPNTYQPTALGAVADSVTRIINLGKYGSFHTNQILGRPYNLTFEILDRSESREGRELRVVPAAELHAVALVEEAETDGASTPITGADDTGTSTPFKSNVNIHDNPLNQKLTMSEIEALKQESIGSGKDLIDKIMQSHSTIDQKTAFSLAKYSLRKHQKYMKWFTPLPLDVTNLLDWLLGDKDPSKIMEIRNETLGLIGCWANVHFAGHDTSMLPRMDLSGRYLVVDDTGGLVLSAVAERMGILHQTLLAGDLQESAEDNLDDEAEQDEAEQDELSLPHKPRKHHVELTAMSATSNSITLIHANQQPNLNLLRYFNFDTNSPTPSHPLYTSLRTLSWLQLVDPESDQAYQEPEFMSPEELANAKPNRRSTYYRKRRRWERTKKVVDETRAGGFSGLVVATFTDPVSVLGHLVPLLGGGSQIVVYSPQVEPLAELADYYSTARRTAFLNTPKEDRVVPSKNFPLDPTLLLPPMVQTSRVRKWQVLPGRTHPLMSGRGGAEGYVFVATRVLPADGKVQARGRPPRNKKPKMQDTDSLQAESDTPSISKESRIQSHVNQLDEDITMAEVLGAQGEKEIETEA
ncbi:uncharacterized protein A1O9_12445 [Exophiala aquamarina CBS 119918]|uniref:tRNA (adenine(58)-N(1))-methyltransferase non-catalytic subunit TRM6 n=1 Tax=Exophiala aquamarina CBS 119918 TaxID=1182545 RepID=A0A072NWW0_9EURO|nr:uncharacterized protein A1O9_12445 [Exophiala aquamarina CBS 119918]KEF51528.1 hypothetical protein A1O9_12445 [Exophiala aquamarina CBS 119918]